MDIRPWNENIWFSPAYVINELTRGYLNNSSDKIIKRLKEAWICAVGIICWAKNENTEWWIQLPKKRSSRCLSDEVHSNKRWQRTVLI